MKMFRQGMIAALLVTSFVALSGCWETRLPVSDPAPPGEYIALLDGQGIHYTVAGEGRDTPIVFIHGWACDRSFWRKQLSDDVPEELASRMRIAIDLPGHGHSDGPKEGYRMSLFAEAIAAVMTDAGIKRAILVGHSNGVPVVRQFHRQFPARVSAIVAVDGMLRQWIDDDELWDLLIGPLRSDEYRPFASDFVEPMLGPIADSELREQIRERMLSTPQHVMVGGVEAAADPRVWRDSPLDVPVLMVMARSTPWPLDYEQRIREIAPNLEYHTWRDVSHFLMIERPRRFNRLVARFIQDQNL